MGRQFLKGEFSLQTVERRVFTSDSQLMDIFSIQEKKQFLK